MNFISGDWGTSTFRLRLVQDEVRREIRTDEGTAKLALESGDRAEAFRGALERGLQKLEAPPDWPILLSGMVGSSIGWKELPYASLPFGLDGRDAVIEKIGERTHLVSGLRGATEILRGEETEAMGVVALLGHEMPFESTLILPGTHSKHLQINPGGIADFRTYMTGELYDVLGRLSVLRHSVDLESDFDPAAFREGVEESPRRPLSSTLFRVRTRQVLDRRAPASNASFLSGLLIGTELAELKTSDVPVIVAAGERLRRSYETAADVLGFAGRMKTIDSERLPVLGHGVLLNRILGGK